MRWKIKWLQMKNKQTLQLPSRSKYLSPSAQTPSWKVADTDRTPSLGPRFVAAPGLCLGPQGHFILGTSSTAFPTSQHLGTELGAQSFWDLNSGQDRAMWEVPGSSFPLSWSETPVPLPLP